MNFAILRSRRALGPFLIGSVSLSVLLATLFGHPLWGLFLGLYVALTLQGPKMLIGTWLATICLVPSWAGFTLNGAFLDAISLINLATVFGLLRYGDPEKLGRGDAIVMLVVGSALVATLFSGSPNGEFAHLISLGLVPFLIARLIAPAVRFEWICRFVSFGAALLALLALFELAFGIHPFVDVFSGSPLAFWSELQTRGGVVRSELAFGHSIALGGALSMALPLTVATSLRFEAKMLLLAVITVGLMTTSSRAAILTGGLGVLMTVILIPETDILKKRLSMLGAVVLVMSFWIFFVGPRLSPELEGGGASEKYLVGEEAKTSALYRPQLYKDLAPTIRVSGSASGFTFEGESIQSDLGYTSIDSAPLQFGLTYGWVTLIAIGFALILNLWRVVSMKAGVFAVTFAAQGIMLLTVWLVTQYFPLIWFLAGLVVLDATRGKSRTRYSGEDSVEESRDVIIPV